jgi:hypothetical protein
LLDFTRYASNPQTSTDLRQVVQMELNLPYPPSVNHFFSYYKGRPVLSKDARAYRHRVRTSGHGVHLYRLLDCPFLIDDVGDPLPVETE